MLLLLILAQAAPVNLSTEASREIARQECRTVDQREIVVCARRKPDERYRMPDRDGPFDPAGETMSVMRERMSWIEEGDTGTQSCGPVGPSGWTGCMAKAWKRERDQTQWGKNVTGEP